MTNIMKRINDNRFCLGFAGSASYVFFCLALFAIGRKNNDLPLFTFAHFIFIGVCFLSYALFSLCILTDRKKNDVRAQFVTVNLILSLFLIPLIKLVPVYIRESTYTEAVFLLGSTFLALTVVIADLIKPDSVIKGYARRIVVRRNLYLAGLFIILLILSYERVTYYMWDACLFFRQIDNVEPGWLFDLYKLSFWGHPAYTYTFVASGLKLIFGTAVEGQNFYGRILLLIGAYGFWKLSHLFFDESPEWMHFLLTLSYSVSPFFLGMVTYSYNDSASWYIFPLLLYVLYDHKWIYSFWLGAYFVFIKEPCVVIYSFLLLGIYIMEAVREKKVIHNVTRYLVLLLPCLMFVAAYIFMPRYEETGLILNWSYTRSKIDSFLLVNFNWLFFALGLIAFISCVIKHEYHKYLYYMIPMIISEIAFVVVSVLANTGVVHPRYVDSMAAEILIIEAFFIMIILKDIRIRTIVLGVQILILLVSSYYTINPVMRIRYPMVNVGNIQMVYLCEKVSDGWCYNRQYNNYGYVLDMALEDVVPNQDYVIYTPSGPGNFDGRGLYPSFADTTEVVLDMSWDPIRHTRMTDKDAPSVIPYQLHVILDEHLFDLQSGQQGCYIYTDYCGIEIADRIRETMNVIDESTFEKSGWIMHRITFI